MTSNETISELATRRRLLRLIKSSPRRFDLDLSGLRVLTEAASGPFAATPLIAAYAGAQVRAVTRDSHYGRGQDIAAYVIGLAKELHIEHQLTVSVGPASACSAGCHIVTNLGFVRPIDSAVVDGLDPCAAVSLMWEPWEFRSRDVSLPALAARDVVLIGTRETHPLVNTFSYVAALAGRLLFEAGVEVVGSRIVVVGSDPFGKATAEWLRDAGSEARQVMVPLVEPGPDDTEIDAMVLIEHRTEATILGPETPKWIEVMARDGAPIVRICGAVDREFLSSRKVRLVPDTEVAAGFMSVTTGYLGPRPVVDLHAAGLRAAQDVVRARQSGMGSAAAVAEAVNRGFALAFEDSSVL